LREKFEEGEEGEEFGVHLSGFLCGLIEGEI
jgi:hypothetical protein